MLFKIKDVEGTKHILNPECIVWIDDYLISENVKGSEITIGSSKDFYMIKVPFTIDQMTEILQCNEALKCQNCEECFMRLWENSSLASSVKCHLCWKESLLVKPEDLCR